MEIALHAEGLTKQYSSFRIDNVNFRLPRGYIMGLIGRNGAGKTTTIKLILGIAQKESGRVDLLGRGDPAGNKHILSHVGFCLDDSGHYSELTAAENAKFLKMAYGVKWDNAKFQKLIKGFGIPLDKKMKEFSTGMVSQFKIATALCHNAELLILDEPTSGLDPVVRREILSLLQKEVSEQECSILFSTHITSDLDRIADYITLIDGGRVALSDETEEIIQGHQLVKGIGSLQSGDIEKTIGYERGSHGFSAMIKKSALKTPGLTRETPNLEDIMYYYTRREL